MDFFFILVFGSLGVSALVFVISFIFIPVFKALSPRAEHGIIQPRQ